MTQANRSRKRTRVLIVALNFAPELTGIGKYVGEMTEWLSGQGFDIRVVTAPPYYPAWRVLAPYSALRYRRETVNGATVYRCPLYVPGKASGLRRLLHLASFALSSLPVILVQALFWRPDVMFVVEPPLMCAPSVLLASRLCHAHTWLHVQDFELDAARNLGILKGKGLVRFAAGVERWITRRFDRVSIISAGMLQHLWTKGVDPRRTLLFPNWVNTQSIYPCDESVEMRRELGIAPETRVLLYSGNMGAKQGLETVIDAARLLRHEHNLLFLMCGDGMTRRSLEERAADLPNVRFIELRPVEQLNALLAIADVHLLPQRPDVNDLVMPSKLTAIMASGRPVVATASEGSELADTAAIGGRVVPPADPAAMVEAILALLANADERKHLGGQARRFAVEAWDRDLVLPQIRDVLTSIGPFGAAY